MMLDDLTCYRALKARDSRFDGRFFVAVTSTRIYCRPICTVKPPKRENCKFFPSAAAAENAGFRPCLRCRPELAPGNASIDATHRLAHAAASLIEHRPDIDDSLTSIAGQVGITDRHLRRIFQSEFGVTPVAFAQTQRLLLAKRLLTDTTLPVTEVAFASGFGSVRRFNQLLQERYRLSPTQLRKGTVHRSAQTLNFELSYRPPYDWAAMIDFFATRCIPGVEAVDAQRYRRTVRVEMDKKIVTGCITVTRAKNKHALRVSLTASLAHVTPWVLARVKRLFDLSAQPQEIASVLGDLARGNAGVRVPGAFDAFEMVVRAILQTLACRLRDGELDLTPGADVESTLKVLRDLPGIGEWTAQYIAMRALAWPDAFPHTDLGVMKALGKKNPREVLAVAEQWRPWRAYAVMHLWRTLK